MRFEFQLAGLLRVRKILEQRAREQLNAQLSKLHAIEQSIESAQQWTRASQSNIAGSESATAAELHFAAMTIERVQDAIERKQSEHELQSRRVQDAREAYIRAKREYETVLRLHDRAWSEYCIDMKRREQRATDDLFLARSAVRDCVDAQEITGV